MAGEAGGHPAAPLWQGKQLHPCSQHHEMHEELCLVWGKRHTVRLWVSERGVLDHADSGRYVWQSGALEDAKRLVCFETVLV